jgi:hypothetical protein
MAGPGPADLVADGVDAPPVLGLEEAGVVAEGGGDVAVGPRQVVKMENCLPQRGAVDVVGVGRDVAGRQDLGVAGQVNGPDLGPAAFPFLRHPGRAREQVHRRRGPGAAQEVAQDRDQPPLRAEVLDHAAAV